MRFGNVSVLIPEGRERDSGHVEIPHGTQYTLRLGNHHYRRRVDATVTIDGKDMGTYRVDDGGTVTLERSFLDDGRFTFFASESSEAAAAGVANVGKDDRGLIKITFKAEKARPQTYFGGYSKVCRASNTTRGGGHVYGGPAAMADGYNASEKTSGGITGLTGSSSQTFTRVADLDVDPAETVTITLRLVATAARPAVRELTPVRGNAIPSPV